MELLAHAGDAGLYVLVPSVVFFIVFRLVRGPLPDEPKRPAPQRARGS